MTIADIDKLLAELGRDKKQSEGWSLAERLHRLVSGGCFGAHLCDECNAELLKAAVALEGGSRALKALRAVLVLCGEVRAERLKEQLNRRAGGWIMVSVADVERPIDLAFEGDNDA